MTQVGKGWVAIGGVLLGVVGTIAATNVLYDPGSEAQYCVEWIEGREPTIQRFGQGAGSDQSCSTCLLTMTTRVELGRDHFVDLSEECED